MVEIFKTNITDKETADEIVQKLEAYLPASKINFDLGDRDKILRIDSPGILPSEIEKLISTLGYYCEALD